MSIQKQVYLEKDFAKSGHLKKIYCLLQTPGNAYEKVTEVALYDFLKKTVHGCRLQYIQCQMGGINVMEKEEQRV